MSLDSDDNSQDQGSRDEVDRGTESDAGREIFFKGRTLVKIGFRCLLYAAMGYRVERDLKRVMAFNSELS